MTPFLPWNRIRTTAKKWPMVGSRCLVVDTENNVYTAVFVEHNPTTGAIAWRLEVPTDERHPILWWVEIEDIPLPVDSESSL
jgi:hypothetical protein